MKFATINSNGVRTAVVGTDDARWIRLGPLLDLLGLQNQSRGKSVNLTDLLGTVHDHYGRVKAVLDLLINSGSRDLFVTGNLDAPLINVRKNIFCVGRNYYDHVAEGARLRHEDPAKPAYPVFFSKPPTVITGPDQKIPLHSSATKALDYEAELAVVIGRKGRDISCEEAMDYVFGYTIVNDVTGRDLQMRHGQWFKGKALDGSLPMGPWIVDAQEIPNPHELDITLSVNGQLRQNANTKDMIFDIPSLISELSRGLTLEPGDIVATGTPAGVGFAMDPQRALESGDTLKVEIDKIGVLINSIE